MTATPRVLTGNTTLFGTATPNYTVNKPTGIIDGDFLLIQFGINNTAAGTFTTVPSGWIPLFTTNPYWLTPSNTIAAFYKFASSEPSTWGFVYSATSAASAIVFAASGVDTGSPINILSTMDTGGNATHIAPSITTTVANCIQIAGAIHQSGTTQDLASPAGWTEVGSTYVDGATAAGRIGAIAHNGNVALGATSTATFTGTQALTGIAWQAALRPAAGQVLTQTIPTNITGITDANIKSGYSGVTVDNVGASDIITPISAFGSSLLDVAGITDVNVKAGYSGTTIDNTGASDTLTSVLTSAQSFIQTLTDLTGITDANIRSGYAGATIDNINSSDILTPILTAGTALVLTLLDNIGLTEEPEGYALDTDYSLIDSIGLIDSVSSSLPSSGTKFILGNIEVPAYPKFISGNIEVSATIRPV